jgi:hypothetical protein
VKATLKYPPGGDTSVAESKGEEFPAVLLTGTGYLARGVRSWALLEPRQLSADNLTARLVSHLATLVSEKLQICNKKLEGMARVHADLGVSSKNLARFIRNAAVDINGREGGALGAHDPQGFVAALVRFCNSESCVLPDGFKLITDTSQLVAVLRKVDPSKLLGGMFTKTSYKPWVVYRTPSGNYQ